MLSACLIRQATALFSEQLLTSIFILDETIPTTFHQQKTGLLFFLLSSGTHKSHHLLGYNAAGIHSLVNSFLLI